MPEIKISSEVDMFYEFSELDLEREKMCQSLLSAYGMCNKLISIVDNVLIFNDLSVSSYVKSDAYVISFFNSNFPLDFYIGDDVLPSYLYKGLYLLFPDMELHVSVQESNGGERLTYIVTFTDSGLIWGD